MLGRRGPAQAAFTNPELRELGELARAEVYVDPADLELDPHSAAWLENEGRLRPPSATSSCCAPIRSARAQRAPGHRIWLRFLDSPVEILGEGEDGRYRRSDRLVTGSRPARTGGCARSAPASRR